MAIKTIIQHLVAGKDPAELAEKLTMDQLYRYRELIAFSPDEIDELKDLLKRPDASPKPAKASN